MSMDRNRILETCQTLWQSVLGLNLDETNANGDGQSENLIASYVQLSGGWDGAVVVECAESITRHAAAMMFQEDAEELTASDLQDALNELTRLIGKNMQKRLSDPGKVSTPKPLPSGEMPSALASMRDLEQLQLDCEGRYVRIGVREGVAAPSVA